MIQDEQTAANEKGKAGGVGGGEREKSFSVMIDIPASFIIPVMFVQTL